MQQTVSNNLGFGVTGEFYDASPRRTQVGILNSTDAANNVFGRVFTIATGANAGIGAGAPIFQAGGSGTNPSIMVGPKNHASYGTSAGGPLAPTLTLANGVEAEFASMGRVVVTLPAGASVGDAIKYNTTTGVIGTGAPGAGEAALTGASIHRFTNSAAGLAVISLTAN